MGNENSRSKKIELETMVKLVVYGISMWDITISNCLILRKIFLLFLNFNQIQFLLMLIGVKISNIEEEMKSQEHKLKSKDCRYYKERTKSLEKNTIRKNDVNIKILFIKVLKSMIRRSI